MKTVINISLGGRSFTLEEDAFGRLNKYLEHYRTRLSVPELQKAEVMEEIENRIAELFCEALSGSSRRDQYGNYMGQEDISGKVVTLPMVEKVARELGMPDGRTETSGTETCGTGADKGARIDRKLYRDIDNKSIAGVCAGLAIYLDLDVTVVRVLMLAAFILGSAGFWVYLILWLAMPAADTPAKKCDMHGIPATAENMSRFARSGYKR